MSTDSALPPRPAETGQDFETSAPGPRAAGTALAVRDALAIDLLAICEIYTPYVLYGAQTFEEVPPSLAAMTERRAQVLAHGLPFLVAERGARVLGYCYATPYRSRPAYRYTVEDSIYVAHDCTAGGVGTALLEALIRRCERGPWRQMISVIGDSDNAASIRLHTRHGFEPIGICRAVGFKHGRWIDTVLMQRALGAGDRSLPSGRA